MSRIPPQIKQHIDGQPVNGYSVQPITKDGVTYEIDSEHRLNDLGYIIGMDWSLKAIDTDSNILWELVYFPQDFIEDLEIDVQEQYPIDFLISGEEIVIEHEYDVIFYISVSGILLERK